MHRCLVVGAVALVFFIGPADAQQRHPYRSGQPVASATLFAPGLINTDADEYGPTFVPDGTTIYFTRRNNRDGNEFIVYSQFKGGVWTSATVASFSGRYSDKEPFIAPDGSKLFFASTRPGDPGGPDKAFDIYLVEREGQAWGSARRLASFVNSNDYDNYPSVARSGNLYFGSRREGGLGRVDLYMSRFVNGEYQAAENLGPIVNSPATDADPYIAPDESYMIFSSTRDGGYGSGDLYISYRRGRSWTEPRNLGRLANTPEFEYTPLVTPDGRYLFFSRGWGEIYFIEMSTLGIGTQ
jgi:Tol biopolymer transport system component